MLLTQETLVAVVLNDWPAFRVSALNEIPENPPRRAFKRGLGFRVGDGGRREESIEVARLEVGLFDEQSQNLLSRLRPSKGLRGLSLRR